MGAEEKPSYHQPGVQRVLTTKDESRRFYDKIAKVYDLLSEHSEEPMRQKCLAMLAVQPGERVLEIGFGTGHSLVELARAAGPGGRVLGIDLSEKMLEVTRKRIEKAGVADRVELTIGDAEKLPYEDTSLDALFTSFTLELFDTPAIPVVLGECRRVLRPGGRLGVVSTSRVRPDSLVTEIYEWSHRHFPNLLDCRPILVRQAVEDAGFRIQTASVEKMWVYVEIVVGVKD